MTGDGLADRLREGTRSSHRRAERTGIMGRLLHGAVGRDDYCRLLWNLHPIYAALERALDHHAEAPLVAAVRVRDLYRAAALAADLDHLHGAGWRSRPVASATSAYIARLDHLDAHWPAGLVAHAYVRYLGDLNGGRILHDAVGAALGLEAGAGARFYDFGGPLRAETLKRHYRSSIDSLQVDAAATEAIVTEAESAFARHIQLFEELDSPALQR